MLYLIVVSFVFVFLLNTRRNMFRLRREKSISFQFYKRLNLKRLTSMYVSFPPYHGKMTSYSHEQNSWLRHVDCIYLRYSKVINQSYSVSL